MSPLLDYPTWVLEPQLLGRLLLLLRAPRGRPPLRPPLGNVLDHVHEIEHYGDNDVDLSTFIMKQIIMKTVIMIVISILKVLSCDKTTCPILPYRSPPLLPTAPQSRPFPPRPPLSQRHRGLLHRPLGLGPLDLPEVVSLPARLQDALVDLQLLAEPGVWVHLGPAVLEGGWWVCSLAHLGV